MSSVDFSSLVGSSILATAEVYEEGDEFTSEICVKVEPTGLSWSAASFPLRVLLGGGGAGAGPFLGIVILDSSDLPTNGVLRIGSKASSLDLAVHGKPSVGLSIRSFVFSRDLPGSAIRKSFESTLCFRTGLVCLELRNLA